MNKLTDKQRIKELQNQLGEANRQRDAARTDLQRLNVAARRAIENPNNPNMSDLEGLLDSLNLDIPSFTN